MERKSHKSFVKVTILLLCFMLLFAGSVSAASAQYFTSGSYTYSYHVSDYPYQTNYYKCSTAAYSYDEYHYIRARIEDLINGYIYTDSGRRYSNYANFCESPAELVGILYSDHSVNYYWKIAKAYWGSY